MITIHKSGKISIPQEDGFIGYAGDNLNKTLEFIVEDQTDKTFYYRAYLEFDDDTVNYFILSRKFVDGNTILVWQVTEDQLYKDGIVYLQIKAFSTAGEVFHTEKVPIFVGASIEFCNYLAERPNSEFIQQEEQLNNLLFDIEKAKEFLPYIGENGNWYVYDYEFKTYYNTGKTALGSAEKYPLTTEVNSESTDENGASAKAVYTYGNQILSDSKDYFSTNAGELEYLNTEDKSTLVNAINELENIKISNVIASVSNKNLANQSVTSEKIADLSVTENKIADESVTNSKLAKSSVTTDKIKIGSVTSSKLASGAVSEIVLSPDLRTKINQINAKLDKPTISGTAGQVLMTSGGENGSIFWGAVSSTDEGLTTIQINALDAMFKKCAFTSNATAEYEAFKTAFGISDETTEPDTPVVPDEPDIPTEPDEPTQFTDYSVLTGYYVVTNGTFKTGGYNTAYFEVKAGETYASTAFNGKTAPQFFLVESGYAGQTTQQTAIEYVNEYPDSLSMHTTTYTVPQDGCLLIPYLAESGITIVKE